MSASKGSILVTGANGGLGSAIAQQIASKPELSAYRGIYTVRDTNAATGLIAALSQGPPSHLHDILSLDLTDLESVRQVAEDVNVRVFITAYCLLLPSVKLSLQGITLLTTSMTFRPELPAVKSLPYAL